MAYIANCGVEINEDVESKISIVMFELVDSLSPEYGWP
jgi:hypothetical protein